MAILNIRRLGNVILAVKDLDASVKFYNEIIGLPIKQQRRTWVDLGSKGALISLHPAALTAPHTGTSVENGVMMGFIVGDVKTAVEELKGQGVKIFRDIVERDAGLNAIILDPDEYMISLFEPNFSDKTEQSGGGYQGFTPA